MIKTTSLRVAGLCLACTALVSAQAPPRPAPADFSAPGPSEPLPPQLAAGLDRLQASSLAAHITFLASSGMEGRALGSRGLEATAEYAAAALRIAGVAPFTAAGKGPVLAPYFQGVPILQVGNPSGSVRVEIRRGESAEARTFLAGVDCLFPELPPGEVTAPLVFAGYGIREASPARDDYRGLDVQGKIVLVLAGLPAGAEWQKEEFRSRYAAESGRSRYAAKAELARALGARALLAVEGERFPALLAAGESAPAATYFVGQDRPAEALPVVRVTPAVGAMLLPPAGLTPASAPSAGPQALPGASATVRVTGEERLVISRNVIGVLPGADAALRDDAVIIGAHMDHLGRSGTRLYPGADDNASGVSALLEIARAFASGPRPPRRTVIFAFWTGEEEGHLGSEYFVRHPLWPLDRTSVYLNLDMIGHAWKIEEIRQLVADARLDHADAFLAAATPERFIELGVAESAPELGPVLVRASKSLGLALHLDRTDGRSGGSDYRAFARQGVRFVRFFGNYFDSYHEPGDTAEAVDSAQVLRMARLAYATAWLMADR